LSGEHELREQFSTSIAWFHAMDEERDVSTTDLGIVVMPGSFSNMVPGKDQIAMKFAMAPALCLLLLASGCGSNDAEKTMGGGEGMYYPEFETFNQEGLLGVAYPASKKNWAEVKRFAKSDAFSAAVSKFDAAPLPPENSDRKAAKDQLVAAAKALHEKAAANASNQDLEGAYKGVTDAMKALYGG
jgi:hypothetical protein